VRTQPLMSIGEVARHAGIRASTIRYYETLGILPTPQRVSGQRRYDIDVLRRLAIIDIAQRAGFSLAEAGELLAGAAGQGSAGEHVRDLAERKLPAIQALIDRAEAVQRWLQVASVCECSTLDACALFDDHALGLPPRTESDSAVNPVTVITVTSGSLAKHEQAPRPG